MKVFLTLVCAMYSFTHPLTAKQKITYFTPDYMEVLDTPHENRPNLVSFKVHGTTDEGNVILHRTVGSLRIQNQSKTSWSVLQIGKLDNKLYPHHCIEQLHSCELIGYKDENGRFVPVEQYHVRAQFMDIKREAKEKITEFFFQVSIPTATYLNIYLNLSED